MKDFNKEESYMIIKSGDYYVSDFSQGSGEYGGFIGFTKDRDDALKLLNDFSGDYVGSLFKELDYSMECKYQLIQITVERTLKTIEKVINESKNIDDKESQLSSDLQKHFEKNLVKFFQGFESQE